MCDCFGVKLLYYYLIVGGVLFVLEFKVIFVNFEVNLVFDVSGIVELFVLIIVLIFGYGLYKGLC